MSVIKVENLIKNYKKSTWKESEEDVTVLKGLSFQAEQGEFVGIMGKSGCGKTSCPEWESRFPVGSSARISSGSLISALQIATL